jgi:hypothetical protein
VEACEAMSRTKNQRELLRIYARMLPHPISVNGTLDSVGVGKIRATD